MSVGARAVSDIRIFTKVWPIMGELKVPISAGIGTIAATQQIY